MRSISRRHFGILGMASVASVIPAHSPAQETLAVTPKLGELSPDVRKKLSDIVVQQQLNAAIPNFGTLAKPSDDPDYYEFWIEMKPANPDAGLISPGNPELKAAEYSYWKNALKYAGETSWSEEAYAEITPDFADMYPSPTDKEMNAIITMKAVEKGATIKNQNFYQDIVRSLSSK